MKMAALGRKQSFVQSPIAQHLRCPDRQPYGQQALRVYSPWQLCSPVNAFLGAPWSKSSVVLLFIRFWLKSHHASRLLCHWYEKNR